MGKAWRRPGECLIIFTCGEVTRIRNFHYLDIPNLVALMRWVILTPILIRLESYNAVKEIKRIVVASLIPSPICTVHWKGMNKRESSHSSQRHLSF